MGALQQLLHLSPIGTRSLGAWRRRTAVAVGSLVTAGSVAGAGWVVAASAEQQRQRRTAAAPAAVAWEDHKVGEGTVATSGETVRFHYEGRLSGWAGPVFESSYAIGEPVVVKLDVDPVIQGWHDGIRGMRTGGRRKLTIPPALAYGKKGIKDPARNRWIIPPDATLFYRCANLSVLRQSVQCAHVWLTSCCCTAAAWSYSKWGSWDSLSRRSNG
jgi:peptidylprolyl isomerase